MGPVLEARGLVKRFRPTLFGKKVAALKGVSFAVDEGECFGLLGQNGAGKTTAIKILTGLLEADEGEATLLGRSSRESTARRELGYLPENPYFHEHLTPIEGLDLYGRLVGLTRAEIQARAPALLERVGLTDAAARRLRGFSKGMRQRFGLAAALLHEPPLLLLDEPLSGLDPGGRLLVKEVILEQRRAGRTVLLCSHVLADVQELCDRVVVLDRGEVVRSGTIHELLESAPRSFELCAEQVDEELRNRIAAVATLYRMSGDVITARLPGAELGPGFAAEVHAHGARLLSLVPERESLEEWFVRLTGAGSEGSEPVAPIAPPPEVPAAEPEAVA
jgi:ABC-2 type transport system ATP-binding protein